MFYEEAIRMRTFRWSWITYDIVGAVTAMDTAEFKTSIALNWLHGIIRSSEGPDHDGLYHGFPGV